MIKQIAQAIASCNLLKGSEEIFSLMKMTGKTYCLQRCDAV